MAAIQDAQQDTMATIDASKVLVDKVLSILQLVSISPSLSLNFATNPIGFLLQLLEHLGVTYEELRDWLANFLIYIIPLMEVSIKAILLTNLKNMVSCATDPRIPDKYRKQHKAPSDYNTSQLYGIDISLESIDFFNKLTVNPLSEEGKEWYFGLDDVDNVYKFARAEDFDAFLWFVMHKGKFPNSTPLKSLEELGSHSGDTLLDTVTVSSSDSNILQGNTFTYSGSAQVISLCIEALYGQENNIVKNVLVPVSDDWNSVNWYTRRGDYLTRNMGIGKKEPRFYSKESGICNLQFLDQANATESPLTGLVNNKFRFTILPRPYVHIPNVDEKEPPWRFKKLLFNSNGEYDPKGKYTIPLDTTESVSGNKIKLSVGGIQIDIKSGNVTIGDKTDLMKHLLECYPGLTVYEFNYDYVMGMKLFDAKVLATTLLDSLINMRLGVGATFGMQHEESVDQIKTILKDIIESDDISIDDCYFNFSNAKYDALSKNAEERKAQKKDVKEIKDVLNGLDESASLNEQVDVINRAITQASTMMSEGVPEEDKFKAKFNFVTDMIEQLTFAVVKAVLSPKVLMLFEVNETIMGGKWQKFNFSDLIKAMREIISSIIREIRDLIVQELLKMVLKVLSPIIATLTTAILREQIENYTEAIDDIIRNCSIIWFRMGNSQDNSDSKLDTVDYADIDTSTTKEGQSPQTKKC